MRKKNLKFMPVNLRKKIRNIIEIEEENYFPFVKYEKES